MQNDSIKFKNDFLILIFAFSILAPGNLFAAESISAPTINVAPQQYYPLEEALYIEGKGPPAGQKIEFIFEKVSGGTQPVRLEVQANSNGDWFLAQRVELASGEWSVRARAVSGKGTSDWSNPRIIRSLVSGFVVGGVTVKYAPIALTLFLAVFASGILLVYAFFRAKGAKEVAREAEFKLKTESLQNEIREKERKIAEAAVTQSFGDLRKNILAELNHLDSKLRDVALSREEEEHREKLLRELREAEENIEKQLKSISV